MELTWSPWSESLGVALLAIAGALLGRWFSQFPKPYWTLGYFFPLSLLALIVVIGKKPELMFVPPTSWLTRGRTPSALMGFIATIILTTPLPHIANMRT